MNNLVFPNFNPKINVNMLNLSKINDVILEPQNGNFGNFQPQKNCTSLLKNKPSYTLGNYLFFLPSCSIQVSMKLPCLVSQMFLSKNRTYKICV